MRYILHEIGKRVRRFARESRLEAWLGKHFADKTNDSIDTNSYVYDYEPNIFERVFLKITRILCYIICGIIVLCFINFRNDLNVSIILGFTFAIIIMLCIAKRCSLYEKTGIKQIWVTLTLFWLNVILFCCAFFGRIQL